MGSRTGAVASALLGGFVGALVAGRVRARTERARAEVTVRDQVDLLAAIVDAMTDGVAVVDADGRFVLRNPAAVTLTGVDFEVGDPDDWQVHFGIYRPEDGTTPFPREELPLIRALAGEVTDGVEMLLRNEAHPNGVLLSVHGRPLRLADGRRRAVVIFTDITAVRAREAELFAFSGMVAHDLKSPLNAVAGFAEILQGRLARGTLDEATLRLAVERVHTGIRETVALVDDLLAYATVHEAPLRPQVVELDELVGAVVAQRTDHLRSAGAPVPDVDIGALSPVTADPVLLRQVLDNLIGNALTYVRAGGPARIGITASAAPRAGWVRVEVADRGPGIPDAHKQRVLDPFHRVPDNGHHAGSGLGLAICRRVVERHGGTIVVTDNPGGGTRVWFTLPDA